MSERHDKAKALADKVAESKDRGSDIGAKQAFTKEWKEAVPELPHRIPALLVRVDPKAVNLVLARIRDDRQPELKVDGSFETGFCVRMSRGKKTRIGDLSARDLETLRELGKKALKVYKPQLLEVTRNEQGKVNTVAIELVRPEGRLCSSCGKPFYEDRTNCKNCRQKRKKLGEQSYEHSPVAFHEAVEEMIKEDSD
jgi:hypothetical protein